MPWRQVGDFRPLNSQTKRVSYPLPVIEDILVKQGKKYMYSILDLRQAFHQQPLDRTSRPLTACHTPLGIFQWRVNVMRLMNAGQQFQAMMEDVLEELRENTDPYIDDILVGIVAEEGENLFEKHYEDVRRLLNQLKEQSLVADIRK